MRAIVLGVIAATALAVPATAAPSIGAGDTMNIVGNATFNGVDVTFAANANLVSGTGACLRHRWMD